MKKPIELVEGIVKIVHEVLGTVEGWERHAEEVTEAEAAAIHERIAAFLTPGLDKVPPVDLKTGKPVDPPAQATQR